MALLTFLLFQGKTTSHRSLEDIGMNTFLGVVVFTSCCAGLSVLIAQRSASLLTVGLSALTFMMSFSGFFFPGLIMWDKGLASNTEFMLSWPFFFMVASMPIWSEAIRDRWRAYVRARDYRKNMERESRFLADLHAEWKTPAYKGSQDPTVVAELRRDGIYDPKDTWEREHVEDQLRRRRHAAIAQRAGR